MAYSRSSPHHLPRMSLPISSLMDLHHNAVCQAGYQLPRPAAGLRPVWLRMRGACWWGVCGLMGGQWRKMTPRDDRKGRAGCRGRPAGGLPTLWPVIRLVWKGVMTFKSDIIQPSFNVLYYTCFNTLYYLCWDKSHVTSGMQWNDTIFFHTNLE